MSDADADTARADDADSVSFSGGAGSAFDIDYPRAVLAVLVVAVGVGLLVAGSTSTTAFGAYNPAWDGTDELRALATDAGAESRVLRNASAYGRLPGNGTVAVVLSPTRPYGPNETRRLRSFVERGGTLVVAEDVGPYANPLLASVGAAARVNGSLIRDEQSHYRSPALAVATNVTDHPLLRNVSALTLNYGTAVEPGTATVLVRTSEFAYLDTNRDGALNDNETMAAFPVVTAEAVGDGRVLVAGDPSLFINAMLERSGNRGFVRALFDTERVVFDYSHAGGVPPLVGLVLTLRASPLLQSLVGFAGVVGLAWLGRRPDALDRARAALSDHQTSGALPVDREAVVAAVARRHPEWDEERLRRVMRGVMNDGGKGGGE